MIQVADGLGFTLEAFTALKFTSQVFGKNLDGNSSIQAGVGSVSRTIK